MSYHHFYKHLDQTSRELFPSLKTIGEVQWDRLVSPIELRLPLKIKLEAEAAIRALYAVSRRPAYRAQLESVDGISSIETPHRSVLMAYDFHTDEQGNCSLVEVNTNAAGFMLSSVMEMTHAQSSVASYEPLRDLRKSFETEAERFFGGPRACTVAIADDEVVEQKMYSEFLMYRDWFKTFGWNSEIVEAQDFKFQEGRLFSPSDTKIDLVYNRLTDFYLEEERHRALYEAHTNLKAALSPNPREYWLIADKQRLIQLGQAGFLESAGATPEERAAIDKVLIPTFDKSSFASQEEIWTERKGLFFKPKRSHGGKSVYRGESVSRKVFERLMQEDILIQRFRAAQRVPTDDDRSVLSTWKFDLRFYVYEDRVQMTVARIYQGQVTNFSSPMGGFTLVRFT